MQKIYTRHYQYIFIIELMSSFKIPSEVNHLIHTWEQKLWNTIFSRIPLKLRKAIFPLNIRTLFINFCTQKFLRSFSIFTFRIWLYVTYRKLKHFMDKVYQKYGFRFRFSLIFPSNRLVVKVRPRLVQYEEVLLED